MIKIVSSTNRLNSVSMQVSIYYQKLLNTKNLESEIINLAHLPADFLASALYENNGKNESFNITRQKMIDAEKYIFVIPEYNGTFPGVLKTFVDGCKFPETFTGKKAALIGISAGIQGGVLALSHFTDILNYCGTNVLAQKPKLSKINEYFKDGELKNELYVSLLKEQINNFINF